MKSIRNFDGITASGKRCIDYAFSENLLAGLLAELLAGSLVGLLVAAKKWRVSGGLESLAVGKRHVGSDCGVCRAVISKVLYHRINTKGAVALPRLCLTLFSVISQKGLFPAQRKPYPTSP